MTTDDNSTNGTNGRGERLQVMLDAHELSALDDFRFRDRMPSRAAAVRELLKRGLAAEGFLSATVGKKSAEFGVIEGAENQRVRERGRTKRPQAED